MDFYAVLDQVLELLRQRGRVTYNALSGSSDSTMPASARSERRNHRSAARGRR